MNCVRFIAPFDILAYCNKKLLCRHLLCYIYTQRENLGRPSHFGTNKLKVVSFDEEFGS